MRIAFDWLRSRVIRPQKHVRRARIVLLSGERLPVLAVARQSAVSRL
jgi:hypothetical protein